MRKRHYLIAILLSFWLNQMTFAQTHLLDLQIISSEEGLAHLSTTAVFKSSDGLMWIATKYGLNRYDGYTFKNYTKQKNGLYRNQDISRIEEGADGKLWLFYDVHPIQPRGQIVEAVDVFDPLTEMATPLQDYLKSPLPFLIADIRGEYISTPTKQIWIPTEKGELYLFEKGELKLIHTLPERYVYCLASQKEDVWIGYKREILHLRADGEVLAHHSFSEIIHNIWITEAGEIMAATKKSVAADALDFSLWKKEKGAKEFAKYSWGKENNLLKNVAGHSFFIHCDQKEQWFLRAVSSDNPDSSFFKIILDQGKTTFDIESNFTENYIPKIYDFYEDERRLWVSTGVGILKLEILPNNFQLLYAKDGISDSRGMAEDENGNIYFLSDSIFQWNPNTQKTKLVSAQSGAFTLIYHDHLLYSSVYNTTFSGYKFNLKTQQGFRLPLSESFKPFYTYLQIDDSDEFLLGRSDGLSFFNMQTDVFSEFQQYNEFEELKEIDIFHFHENKMGVWMATEGGIYLYRKNEGIIRHFSLENEELPVNCIKHIYEDTSVSKKQVFWLATCHQGIVKWMPSLESKKPSTYQQYTVAEGLADNNTYAIYEDKNGFLWIPSNKGLMRMNKKNKQVKTYTTEDGLPHNEFNTSSHYQAKNGTLYFGGLGGVISFQPKKTEKKDSNHSPMRLLSFGLWEKGNETITDKTTAVRNSGEIVIKPNDKFFELTFSLLSYDNPEEISYSYQIKGFDNQWRAISDNSLRITNLPYGNYLLNVKGQESRFGVSTEKLQLKIRVLKPFYLKWWFFALMALAIVLGTLFFVRRRGIQQKLERKRLEAEVKSRTKTIQKQTEELKLLNKTQTRFFSNITHEFRTPLTLILGPVQQLIKDAKTPNTQRGRLEGVRKNAVHLLNLINQLLDISKVESGLMQLEISRGDIVNYTQELIDLFKLAAQEKQISIDFVTSKNSWETNFDKDKWNKIIYNLLSNAVKFTPPNSNGLIKVTLQSAEKENLEWIKLEIKDNGIGIKKD